MAIKEQRYKDPSLNRFTKTNMYYVDDPYILFQDPTYLGFKLFFAFDQPESGLLSTIDPATDSRYMNTAYGYLKRIGEDVRAEYLARFVNLLKGINSKTPWFWQSIEGLGDAWKHGYHEEAFKSLLPKDRKIKINCLDESIDLRITALIDLYRKACFDWPNRREIVPRNLRFFNVAIYCYESRIINRTGSSQPLSIAQLKRNETYPPEINKHQQANTRALLGVDPLESSTSADYAIDSLNVNTNRVMFSFDFCEFLPDESGTFFDGVTNKEMKLNAQSLAFSYRNVYEDNVFNIWSPNKKVSDLVTRFIDSLALDNPQVFSTDPFQGPINSPNNPKFNVIQAVDNYLGISRAIENFQSLIGIPNNGFNVGNAYGLESSSLPPIAQAALNQATDFALGQLNNLLLGNVYGFGIGDIQSLAFANPASLIDSAIGAIQGGNNASLSNDPGSISGNVGFGESVSISNKEDSSPASSQSTGNANASASNDDGSTPANSQSTGNANASINNLDGSSPASSQSTGNANASASNDDGPDSTSQSTGNANASLGNATNDVGNLGNAY